MIDLLEALVAFVISAATLALLLWPQSGVVWHWRRTRSTKERVELEDSLKHVYDCEYRGRRATVESLSGALGVSQDCGVQLIWRLDSLGLLRTTQGRLQLTPGGRAAALHVIRVHRLCERYLADRTGLDESKWHQYADRREHTMSSEEVETLAADLGDPRFDPHGDPIPTAAGDIDRARGQSLASLAAGQAARIVHVEDEPAVIYDQLIAQGLHPGMCVRVINATPSQIRFEADGEAHVLSPIAAANVAVVPLREEERCDEPMERLADLRPRERATVTGISPACHGPQLRRLLDLGFVAHTIVEAELRSPTGDPTAYRVRGTLIALRYDQARLVYIRREPSWGRLPACQSRENNWQAGWKPAPHPSEPGGPAA